MEVQASSVLPQQQGLWVQYTWVWHRPSWRRSPVTYHGATRTHTGLGKQTLGGHEQHLGHTRTQEKGAVTPERLTQTCPLVSRSLWCRRGLAVACSTAAGTECSSACIGPFEAGRHYLHYLHHSLAPGK